ncbi:hypothetical protein CWE08_10415 [Aliidiomarina iranensis]|uniref:Uncharacterized protein n=1 Tax=Aliidiomarina iranensis TaxID=1434071 RepID=A0A432VRP9_9GAMM|nr:hypothetical protein [Aliidiomarina iranensis]RUO18965.1 hypothetical protein CWE08_10415 [Aliidiomarina iranensis]
MKQVRSNLLLKHLGLPKQLALVCAAIAIMGPSASANENSELAEEMRACAAISNAMERLVCFDDLTAELPEFAVAEEAREAGQTRGSERAADAASAGQARAQQARGEALSSRERAAQERIAAAERRAEEAEERLARQQSAQQRAEAEAERRREEAARNQPPSSKTYVSVAEAWQNPRGLWRFRLENGQVWEQTSSESGIRYRENQRYYIEPGAFGSFFLGTDANNRRMRVRLAD